MARDTSRIGLLDLTILYGIGNLSIKIFSTILVFVTTFYLTKEEFGVLDFILVSVSIVSPIMTLQLSDSVLRWLIDDNSLLMRRKIFTNVFLVIIINSLLFGLICLVIGMVWHLKYLWISFSLLITQSLLIFFQQFLRGIGENRKYVQLNMGFTLSYVVLSLLSILLLEQKLLGLIYSNIISIIIVIASVFISRLNFRQYFSLSVVNLIFLKSLIKYSTPLLPNTISWWVISSSNRFLILFYIGKEANGIFALSNKLPTLLLMFSNIFYLAWQEKSLNSYKSTDAGKYFTSNLDWYIRALFSCAILIVAFSKIIFSSTIDDKFSEALNYSSLILFSSILSALAGFYGTAFLSFMKSREILLSSIIGSVLSLCTSLILVPYWGLYGISVSLIIGYLVMLLFRIIRVRDILIIKFPVSTFIKFLSFYFVVSILLFSMNPYIQALNIFLAIFFISFFNYEYLRSFIDILKQKAIVRTNLKDI